MKVLVLMSKKARQPAQATDILGCGEKVAELIPSIVKNDNFNRKLQRETPHGEFPDEWSDPILMFSQPDRWIRLSTASEMGRVVNADTGEPVTA